VSWNELRHQLSAVLPDENYSLGIPPACYADDELLALEQNAVFHHGWVGLGRADRWVNAGDYSAMDIGGVPLIVLRSKSGALKVFANSCRHRGSQLLSGDGNCKKIKCPFHWWTYDLDGRLKVYPRMENAVDFDPDEFGLVEFAVAVEQGFVFTSFEDQSPAIAEWLGDFDAFHQPWGISHWKTTRVREFEVDCNWKTFIEVFNEYYHLPMVHPDSINWLYPEPDSVDAVSADRTGTAGSRSQGHALYLDLSQFNLCVIAGLDVDVPGVSVIS
jgi:phenylpropionate dioxygenase-like ring-hydroxylating dioxygenase large terminal subunit